jgi:hypothetical protein
LRTLNQYVTAIVLGALLVSPAPAQDVPLELKGDVATVKVAKVITVFEDRTVVKSFPFTVSAPKGGILYQWQYSAGVDAIKKGNVLEIKAAPKGTLTIAVEYAQVDFDKRTVDTQFGSLTFDVGDVTPPRPPTPPDPPTPPAPIPLSGLRVLILYDQAITSGQQGIVYGKKVRDYLQAKCVVGADGKTKDFWILPAGVDVSAAPKWIGDVIQRHPGQTSFLVVSDGKTGYDGPLPATAEDALTVLSKIGGP